MKFNFKMRFSPLLCLPELVGNSFPANALSLVFEVLKSYTVRAGCKFEANKSTVITAVATVCSLVGADYAAAGALKSTVC